MKTRTHARTHTTYAIETFRSYSQPFIYSTTILNEICEIYDYLEPAEGTILVHNLGFPVVNTHKKVLYDVFLLMLKTTAGKVQENLSLFVFKYFSLFLSY